MPASEDKRFSMTGLERSPTESSSNLHADLPPLLPSPFDKLAMETIGEIFSFSMGKICLPPSHIRLHNLQPSALFRLPPSQRLIMMAEVRIPVQIVLCLVCKRWLDITMAHHSLWATFQIDPVRDLKPNFSSQLRRYLQNSGNHLLRIRVRDGSSDQVISDNLDAMMGHSERWNSIEFEFPMKYHFLQQLDAVRDRLPVLQRVHIKGARDPYPTGALQSAAFHHAPLNYISLQDIDPDAIRILDLPLKKVVNANLDLMARQLLLPSLQRLTKLTISRSLNRLDTVSSRGTVFPAVLEKVQILHVLSENSGIEFLACPLLEELEVHNEARSAILKFLDNCSCPPLTRLKLQNLELKLCDPDSDSIPQILRHNSLASLTFLHLACPNLTDQISDALSLDSGQRFPALATLVLDLGYRSICDYRDIDFKSSVEGIRKIVQSRTYPRHPSKPSSGTPPRPLLLNTPRSSLKECIFNFAVDREDWETWQDENIEHLRLFCMSRNVLVLVCKHRLKRYLMEY